LHAAAALESTVAIGLTAAFVRDRFPAPAWAIRTDSVSPANSTPSTCIFRGLQKPIMNLMKKDLLS
jgi:hypothetical protein